jgi:CDP-paratose 2-epimerase
MDENRRGDHICYISDLSKMKAHYPKWGIIKNLKTMFEEISQSWLKRSGNRSA